MGLAGMAYLMITALLPNQIFTFGSNRAGIHGAGAALQARKQFGALQMIGEGLMGQSYALPTVNLLSGRLVQTSEDELDIAVARFLKCAEEHPELEFLLTKVGCGLAGFTEEFMKPKFATAPKNVTKPEGW